MPVDCEFCGRLLRGQPVVLDGRQYCSAGCRDVHSSLEESKYGEPAGDGRSPDHDGGAGSRSDAPPRAAGDLATAFLRVDGMHEVTCERFLEATAEDLEGVVEAEASYVTEAMRVTFDPGAVSLDELGDAVSTVGYTAYPLGETPADEPTAVDRLDDPTPRADREINDLLGFRYAAGVIFGAFMLLPYVVMFYPLQVSALLGLESPELFGDPTAVGGSDRLLALPLFLVLTGVVVLFTGLPVLRGAYVSLKLRRPNTDLLVTLTVASAYVYSTIAFLIGELGVYYDLAVVVAASVVAAIFYESLLKKRAMDRLTDLTIAQFDEARPYDPDGAEAMVPIDALSPGDRIIVREGERIPLDGVLEKGECTVDESIVTGESVPVAKGAGDEVVGGGIVTDNAAVIRVGDRATSRIDQLTASVWDLQSATHGVQKHADRLASAILPGLVAVAVLVGGLAVALGAGRSETVLLTLAVILVGSPWALGLAAPLSVASCIEAAMERGIAVFDESIFERLRDVEVVVFDKTGTLTTGELEVIDTDVSPELRSAVAELERYASHPVANTIVSAFARGSADARRTDGGTQGRGERAAADRVEAFTSHSNGVHGIVDGRRLLVGNAELFEERDWVLPEEIGDRAAAARNASRIPVIVGRDGEAEGCIVVGDEPREAWSTHVARLGDRGIDVVVLTGDDRDAAEVFASHPSIDHVFAGVPPQGKTATIDYLRSRGPVAMVGDGTNDAPALARADLGISLGSGSALASKAADIALIDDDLESIGTAFDLATAAQRRVKQNNRLALVYNGLTVPLAIAGLLNPLFAMGAVVLTGGLIVVNSERRLLDP